MSREPSELMSGRHRGELVRLAGALHQVTNVLSDSVL